MINQQNKQSKKLKNSDSDYKAEDEGSASDNSSWRKYKKATFNLKMTKKEVIEQGIKTFLPIATNLKYEPKPTQEQYEELLNIGDAEEICLNFKCVLGKVLAVIDGEHFKTVLFVNQKPIKVTLRLHGVSTPEIKRAQSRDFANHVKKILKSMIEGKIIRIETGQYDKAGSLYSRVYAYTASPMLPYECESIVNKNSSEFCINDYLIENDMAKGQTKGRNEFGKKSYEDFCDRYETKVWPVVQDYPLELLKEQVGVDYDEREQQDDE